MEEHLRSVRVQGNCAAMSDEESDSTTPPIASTPGRLRDRVTYYERLGTGSPATQLAESAGSRRFVANANNGDGDGDSDGLHSAWLQPNRVFQQQQSSAASTTSSTAHYEVRLRPTPQRTNDGLQSPGGSPFNVKLRHVELLSPLSSTASTRRFTADDDDDGGDYDSSTPPSAAAAALDAQAFEQCLQAQRMQRSRMDTASSPRFEVRLRSTPTQRSHDSVDSPSTPFNVQLRHIEPSSVSAVSGGIDVDNAGDYEATTERRYEAGELVGGERVYSYEKVTLRRTVHSEVVHQVLQQEVCQHTHSSSVRSYASHSHSHSSGTGVTDGHASLSPAVDDGLRHVQHVPSQPSTKECMDRFASAASNQSETPRPAPRRMAYQNTDKHATSSSSTNSAAATMATVGVGYTTPVRVVSYASRTMTATGAGGAQIADRRLLGGVRCVGTADGRAHVVDYTDADDGNDDDNYGGGHGTGIDGSDGNVCGLSAATVSVGNPKQSSARSVARSDASAAPAVSLERYQDYSAHSFQAAAAKMSFQRTNSQYDSHIRQIRGW